jgi:hypothetical protein
VIRRDWFGGANAGVVNRPRASAAVLAHGVEARAS